MKPILFNTEMVRAILGGRKTQTRRICKISTVDNVVSHDKCNYAEYPARNYLGVCANFYHGLAYKGAAKPTYQPGDILYVRETWREYNGKYYYKANECLDYDDYFTKKPPFAPKWHPSIHMPKEAARIFLKVTNVRVEKLQEINYFGCLAEGMSYKQFETEIIEDFSKLWDSIIKPADRDRYGWKANPFVWVCEFKKISESEVKENG